MRRVLAVVVALALMPVVFSSAVSASSATDCTTWPLVPADPNAPADFVNRQAGGVIPGNLIVPPGAFCELVDGAIVDGSVEIQDGAVAFGLFGGVTIDGDVVVGAGAEGQAAGDVTINGDVIVSDDAIFYGIFAGSTVHGDVNIGANAVGVLDGGFSRVTIDGNYECDGCVFEDAVSATITGDLTISGAQDGSFVIGSSIGGDLEVTNSATVDFPLLISSGGAVQPPGAPIVDPTTDPTIIAGDVLYKGNTGPIVVQFSEIGGDVEVTKNDFETAIPNPEAPTELLPAVLRNNTIGGEIEFQKNRNGRSFISENQVAGDVEFDKNTRGAWLIGDNDIGGSLDCRKNQPAPTGSSNTAARLTGQCRGL